MKNRSTIRPLVAGAALLALVATGCGVQGGGTGATQAGLTANLSAASLAQAGQATSTVTSEKVSITIATTPKDGEPSISVTSEGAIDAKAGVAHLTADASGQLGGFGGDATIETIYDGDTVYLKAPFVSMVSGGKPWVKISSDKLADAAGKLEGAVQPEPGSFLTLLQGVGNEVRTLGPEDVRGVPTSHVAVQIDPAKVLAKAKPKSRKALQDHLDALGISLADFGKLPAEAWIDEGGYVRRFQVSYDLANLNTLAKPGAKGPKLPKLDSTITETIELYDFNQPVHVAIPNDAEVATLDLAKLFGN